MPELPTFNVTDAQAERLMRVFGTQSAYKAWLRRQITETVKRHEARERKRQVEDYIASLPPADEDVLGGAQ